MKFVAATWNCQGSPIGNAKQDLLDHLLEKAPVIMLQETGNPKEWGLKDGVRGFYKKDWHALFCCDPAAFNVRCSVGLLIHKDIPVKSMGFVTSVLTYRPLVLAAIGAGGVGSFHAISSNSARMDWRMTGDAMLSKLDPAWWLVGADFNDDMIELSGMDSDSDDEHIGALGGITHKSGQSLDGFKYGGLTRQFAGVFRIHAPGHRGSRFSFSSDHQAVGANFIVPG